METGCLGIQALGTCNYFSNGEGSSILSIGDTISAIALLMTFSQLQSLSRKEIIKESLFKTYWLWGIGVVCIFVSALLPLVPGAAVTLVGYPIFWEFTAALLFLTAIIVLITLYHSRLRFQEKNALRTIAVVERVLFKGNEEDIAEMSQLLQASIDDVVHAMSSYDSFQKRIAEERGDAYIISEHTKNAFHLLRILQDNRFCKVVVTKNPLFSVHLFEELSKIRNHEVSRLLVWSIINQALINKDSILYRESSYGGLGAYKAFSNAAFSNIQFNNNMLPLGHWSPILIKNMEIENFEMFSKCFLKLIDSYIESKDYYQHSFVIYSPGKTLVEYPGYLMSQLDRLPEHEVYASIPFNALKVASKTIKKVVEQLEDNKIMDDQDFCNFVKGFEADDQDHRDYTIVNRVAEWIYELLEAASHTRKYDFQLRSSLISLWIEIYPFSNSGEMSELKLEIQRRLEDKIFKQLEVNFIEGYYPVISRSVISLLGLKDNEENNHKNSEILFSNKFYGFLRENFKNLYEKDKERALDKLPSYVVFDEKECCLIQEPFKGMKTLKFKLN